MRKCLAEVLAVVCSDHCVNVGVFVYRTCEMEEIMLRGWKGRGSQRMGDRQGGTWVLPGRLAGGDLVCVRVCVFQHLCLCVCTFCMCVVCVCVCV